MKKANVPIPSQNMLFSGGGQGAGAREKRGRKQAGKQESLGGGNR